MPRHYQTTLKFSAYDLRTLVAATTNAMAFGCNTPNQPSRTFTTTETPGYWTRLFALYQHAYTVKSTIRVEVVNATVADAILCVLANDNNTTSPSDLNELIERTGSAKQTLGYFSGGDARAVFTHTWTPKPFLGVPADSPDNIVDTGDPPNPFFWLVGLRSLGGGTGNVAVSVTILYELVFSELLLPY